MQGFGDAPEYRRDAFEFGTLLLAEDAAKKRMSRILPRTRSENRINSSGNCRPTLSGM
jgi:hypothetical protein